MARRLTAIGAIALSIFLYWAAASAEDQAAYLFPKVIAASMLVLAVAILIREWAPRVGADAAAVVSVPWVRLWPIFAIFVLYLLAAQQLGFYATSLLAFIAIGVVYSPSESSFGDIKRCVPISLVFLAVLYLVFVVLLQVQTPRGLLF
ncbi:MAG: tripartite tricarboxylate transporter TctB family protein [Gammaproteobacteria bacterium]